MQQGHKETEGKLEYELDWDFIQAMAKRMQLNKGKYEPYNWQKPMDVDKLKQALLRHTVEVMKGNYDDTIKLDHLSAIACNAMMLCYQLKHSEPQIGKFYFTSYCEFPLKHTYKYADVYRFEDSHGNAYDLHKKDIYAEYNEVEK